jgi:hypothetical protein
MLTDTWAIIGTIVAMQAITTTATIWIVNKLDSDIKSVVTRLDGHAQRIDQTYGIILQMLRDGK